MNEICDWDLIERGFIIAIYYILYQNSVSNNYNEMKYWKGLQATENNHEMHVGSFIIYEHTCTSVQIHSQCILLTYYACRDCTSLFSQADLVLLNLNLRFLKLDLRFSIWIYVSSNWIYDSQFEFMFPQFELTFSQFGFIFPQFDL